LLIVKNVWAALQSPERSNLSLNAAGDPNRGVYQETRIAALSKVYASLTRILKTQSGSSGYLFGCGEVVSGLDNLRYN
jgi:hypothetical protein